MHLHHHVHLWEERVGNLHAFKKKKKRTREMVQQLKVLAGFPKDPSLLPSIHVGQLAS